MGALLASTSWSDPLAVATFVLAVATAIGAGVTAKMAYYTRQALDVSRAALSRSERPVLTDVPKEKSLYGLDPSLPKVFVGTDYCEVEVALQNLGKGTAVISHRDPEPTIRLLPDQAWYGGRVDRLLLPGGEAATFSARPNIVPKVDSLGRMIVYCGVTYTDLRGEEKAVTYLCLMRDQESDDLEHHDLWSVHGVAFMQEGELVHSGEDWDYFKP
jgi:hypothetical protein